MARSHLGQSLGRRTPIGDAQCQQGIGPYVALDRVHCGGDRQSLRRRRVVASLARKVRHEHAGPVVGHQHRYPLAVPCPGEPPQHAAFVREERRHLLEPERSRLGGQPPDRRQVPSPLLHHRAHLTVARFAQRRRRPGECPLWTAGLGVGQPQRVIRLGQRAQLLADGRDQRHVCPQGRIVVELDRVVHVSPGMRRPLGT
jgi:hypothetical protein